MDRHRSSLTMPVRFPVSGRGSWKSPPSRASAGLSFWSRTIAISALWSLVLAVAAQLVGPERFTALRYSASFVTAAVTQRMFASSSSDGSQVETRQ
jgi:hypothetical protein